MEAMAVMGEIIQQILIFLRTGSLSLDRCKGSLVNASQSLTVCIGRFHFSRRIANKFFQAVLSHLGLEVFNPCYHGLSRGSKSQCLGKWPRRNFGQNITADHMIYRKATNAVSYMKSESDLQSTANEICKMFKLNKKGGPCSKDATYERVEKFLKNTTYLHSPLNKKLMKLCDGKISNLKSTHVEAINNKFIEFARKGTPFWIVDYNYNSIERKREPVMGEIAVCTKNCQGGGKDELKFGVNPPDVIREIKLKYLQEKTNESITSKRVIELIGYKVERDTPAGQRPLW